MLKQKKWHILILFVSMYALKNKNHKWTSDDHVVQLQRWKIKAQGIIREHSLSL